MTETPAIHNSISLDKLLEYCANPKSSHWNHAWQIFNNRYKLLIYKVVTQRCKAWNVKRLNKQMSDAVNDITSNVFVRLINNNYHLLKKYRSGDNEKLFCAYLVTISDRTAINYILHYFKHSMHLLDNDLIQDYIRHIEPDYCCELFEEIVHEFRKSSGFKKKNLERDINLFMMFTCDELSVNMLCDFKFYRGINKQVFNNVITRMRHILIKS